MREGARGLRRLVPELNAVFTSPFRRSLQTAATVAAVYDLSPRVVPELAAGRDPHQVLAVLETLADTDIVALVGHEPYLSELASLLLSGHARSFVSLKKGAACLLELDAPARPGHASLLWLLTPKQLRATGEPG